MRENTEQNSSEYGHFRLVNMAKQNPNVTSQRCFLEVYVEDCICQGFKFFYPIYFQLYCQKWHQALLF